MSSLLLFVWSSDQARRRERGWGRRDAPGTDDWSKKTKSAPPGASHLSTMPRTLGVAVKVAHANREDLIEAAVSQVEVLEARDEELGPAGLDIRRVSARLEPSSPSGRPR
jgi:hypothetical protein